MISKMSFGCFCQTVKYKPREKRLMQIPSKFEKKQKQVNPFLSFSL